MADTEPDTPTLGTTVAQTPQSAPGRGSDWCGGLTGVGTPDSVLRGGVQPCLRHHIGAGVAQTVHQDREEAEASSRDGSEPGQWDRR